MMKNSTVSTEDLRGVFAVPPLARRDDAARSLAFEQNDLIVRHIKNGGITRLIYGGNAFIYHVTLAEYEEMAQWLSGLDDELWIIPSIGPSFGRAMDQAQLLRSFSFPAVMVLPCADPRDAIGLAQGYREIADAAATRLLLYLKDESAFGNNKEQGLDAVARLVDDGVCVGIKYAVVRDDPAVDPYLESLLRRVDRKFVISGIGERPAVVHLRDWKLPGFTTGSGCIAPQLTNYIFAACAETDFAGAELLRAQFMDLEDLRDAWGPARVLHAAIEAAGIARTGNIPPFVSALRNEQIEELKAVACGLSAANQTSDPFKVAQTS
jgi:dihydrodipicolinate synthase/N-acetylneuraminate lyase